MKSEKITVSLPTETVKLSDQRFADFGFSNRSEFINAAIREYVSRDILKQFSGELTRLYEKIGRTEIKELEDRLAKILYKIAVEQAQTYLLIASAVELPYKIDSRLRGKAVQLVNDAKGFVPLQNVSRHAVDLPGKNSIEDEGDD